MAVWSHPLEHMVSLHHEDKHNQRTKQFNTWLIIININNDKVYFGNNYITCTQLYYTVL